MAVHLPIVPSQAPETFDGQRNLGFRCTQCGNCCKETIAEVTAADVRRLMDGTGLPASRIVEFNPADLFQTGGEDLTLVQLAAGPRAMCLRRRALHNPVNWPCRFLGPAGGCSVYDHRPAICRVWPFRPTPGPRGSISRLTLNPAVDGGPEGITCLYEMDGANDAGVVLANSRMLDREQRLWARQVAAWNRHHAGGTQRAFLAFVGLS